MTLRMLDSIFPANLPSGADAYLGYVGGNWPTFTELERLFPGAHLLSMAVFASLDAEGLDVEPGDASNAQAPAWTARQHARGVVRPVLYTSVSNMDALVVALTAAGIPRASVRLLSAHYGAGEHICGPATCRLTRWACDGTQWRDDAPGNSGSFIDESALADAFFGTPPPSNWTEAIIAHLPTLQIGATDSSGHRFVRRVQGLATALGAPTVIDGAFGPATESAVKVVQRQFGIAEDGVVGPATWGCLVAGQPA